ncbi:plasmid mobilization relaxosome protein MobC, partial [uncultured Prevotella sp.]|uniref:plasmid mobilization protein n=1 Tax=uncultured Prevotella sp. TaxID=159272 RepID=UPI00260660FB
RKLSKSVTVKFSKPSYEALRLRARKANRKLAEYIRESALNGEVVSGHNTETVAIAKNLIGMANNLNQLTKLSHQRGFHETHVFVVDLLRRLKAILGEYRQASPKSKSCGIGRKEDTT